MTERKEVETIRADEFHDKIAVLKKALHGLFVYNGLNGAVQIPSSSSLASLLILLLLSQKSFSPRKLKFSS